MLPNIRVTCQRTLQKREKKMMSNHKQTYTNSTEGKTLMERAKEFLELSNEQSNSVSKLVVNPHESQLEPSFYECFALQGIRLDRVESNLLVCTFKVPPRLIDRDGNLAAGAIANIIDIVGGAVMCRFDHVTHVSVNIGISYLSSAKLNDELEITSRLIGNIGALYGISIVIKNKASGVIVAEGRHSLFSRL